VVKKNDEMGIVEGSAPAKTKEKPTSSVRERRAGYVGAPATLGNFVLTGWKRKKRFE
jgi:hypothetical protein